MKQLGCLIFWIAAITSTQAADPIRIGDLMPDTGLPTYSQAYRQGVELAVEEINAAGGVLGRPLQAIARDHSMEPGSAVRYAQELVKRDRVWLLTGTVLAHVTNAIGNYAAHEGIPLVTNWSTQPIAAGRQNDWMFSIMPTEVQALAAADAAVQLPAKRWALVMPQMAYGELAAKIFKQALQAKRPDVEFVSEQWVPVGKINTGSLALALTQQKPDAICSGLFGSDATAFVREGRRRNLFQGKEVIGMEMGEKEQLDLFGGEIPEGWIVTGYPAEQITAPEHRAFVARFRKKFGEEPRLYSLSGYMIYQFVAEAIRNAGSLDRVAVARALEGLTLQTPAGSVTMDAATHRSTFGVWIGRLAVENGKGTMTGWKYFQAPGLFSRGGR